MALKEDYKDAVFAGLRKYKMLDNGDGTVSPVDMTEYENGGDKFGAKDVNTITKTVNATGEIIADDNDGFKPDQKYVIGDIVIYDNKTWRFKVDHEPGEWDESQVERTNILAVIAEQNKNFDTLSEKYIDKTWSFDLSVDAGAAYNTPKNITVDRYTPYAINTFAINSEKITISRLTFSGNNLIPLLGNISSVKVNFNLTVNVRYKKI